ncbi:transporter substrate-binding domain-containing protein [Pelagibacterium luteolum]|uniref:Polar amino acid transport system substrate-binding protein n=1 Tax=Pelagibacterium luteolum TaxID=440168 RepID=A0A1G7S543_9HYPH|nr:transporter substrate-binding domain-containing protein [Pelagibacterium luteolum]SDG18113.1 polar amino acid transport system substrate-binding protein [Pelagibacterium luteolum]
MKTCKTVLALAGAAALAVGFVAGPVAAQTPDEIQSRGTVNIGLLVDFPPFGILDEAGNPDGYDADVARLLADDMGVELNLVPVTGPNRIPYLVSNQVDILVASLGITPERAEQVDFSEPYAGIEIFVFGDAGLDVSGPEGLSGQNIAVARASTQDTAITEIAPADANIQRFDDDATAVQALLSGQTPLMGGSNVVISQIEAMAPDRFDTKFSLRQQSQAIAVRPGSDELLDYINDFLTRVKADGSINALHEEWVGGPLPEFVVSGD